MDLHRQLAKYQLERPIAPLQANSGFELRPVARRQVANFQFLKKYNLGKRQKNYASKKS